MKVLQFDRTYSWDKWIQFVHYWSIVFWVDYNYTLLFLLFVIASVLSISDDVNWRHRIRWWDIIRHDRISSRRASTRAVRFWIVAQMSRIVIGHDIEIVLDSGFWIHSLVYFSQLRSPYHGGWVRLRILFTMSDKRAPVAKQFWAFQSFKEGRHLARSSKFQKTTVL